MKKEKKAVQSNTFNRILKILLLIIVVFGIVNLSIKLVDLSNKKALLQEKKEQEQAIAVSNEKLEKLIQSGDFDQTIEQALRENGYIRADEKVYTDVAGN